MINMKKTINRIFYSDICPNCNIIMNCEGWHRYVCPICGYQVKVAFNRAVDGGNNLCPKCHNPRAKYDKNTSKVVCDKCGYSW